MEDARHTILPEEPGQDWCSSPEANDRKMTKRCLLNPRAVDMLSNWFEANRHDPYPSFEERQFLLFESQKIDSSMTLKKMQTWFNNARSRKRYSGQISLSQTSARCWTPDSKGNFSAGNLASLVVAPGTPEEWSRPSSRSSYHTALDTCPQAVENGPRKQGRPQRHRFSGASHLSPGNFNGPRQFRRDENTTIAPDCPSSTSSIHEDMFVDASELPHSHDLDVHRDDDNMPQHSFDLNRPQMGVPSAPNVPSTVRYQCTFCRTTDVTAKTLKRHEEKHVPQREYVCMPYDVPFTQDRSHCVFCSQDGRHTTDCQEHIERCLKRDREGRSFPRKDKLGQHIKTYHKARVHSAVLDEWSSALEGSFLVFECGFCGEKSLTWDVRASHMVKHYREGYNMSMWRSGITVDGSMPLNNV